MMQKTKRITRMCLTASALFAAAGGCASKNATVAKAEVTTIDASSFRDAELPRPEFIKREDRAVAMEPSDGAEHETFALVGGPDASLQAGATPGPASDGSTGKAERIIVDRMVGQINGRPIYASEFFHEMDARLRAEAAKREPRDWIVFASRNIDKELADRLRNELLLAEFQSALSPEERQGVLGFLDYIRTNIVRQNSGSSAMATERLQKTEGLTLDEKVEQQKEQQFIFEQVRREVNSRINVSYRDIKQRFEQDRAKYETTPEALLRVVRVRVSDVESLDAVNAAFDRGDSPLEIAIAHGTFNSADDGLHRVELTDADYASTKVFDPPELNGPAQALAVGQTSAPIEYRNSVWWINLEEINLPEEVTLYDKQLQIEQQIRAERQLEEERKYFLELASNGSFSDTNTMKRDLLEFAAERYLILLPQMDGAPDGAEN